MCLQFLTLGCTDLYEAVVRFSAAAKLMVQEHRSKLAVLIFDVVLHRRLTRPAQLIGLLQVVLVGFDFLVVVLL